MGKANISVRLDDPIIARVDLVAEALGRTRGECLRRFIEAQLWEAEQQLWGARYEQAMRAFAGDDDDARLRYNADQVSPELSDDW